MKKKLVSIVTAVTLSAVMAIPAFAGPSPSTAKVMTTPITVSTAVVAQKGYEVTPAEAAAVATTPVQSVQLAMGVTADVAGVSLPDGVTFASMPAQPATIAMAKMDLMKNNDVQKKLSRFGIGTKGKTSTIVHAGQVGFSNGATGSFKVGLSVDGITSAKNVAFLVYVPGETTPRVVKPTFKNGKLQATLPVPCEYNIVTNEAPAAPAAATAANAQATPAAATAATPAAAQATLSTNSVR